MLLTLWGAGGCVLEKKDAKLVKNNVTKQYKESLHWALTKVTWQGELATFCYWRNATCSQSEA